MREVFMKNVWTSKPVAFLGGLAGTCLIATVAFANPSMLPDHPGHPMKALKDPVSGQSLANDPGRELWTGRKALEASTQAENMRAPIQSRAELSGENPNEVQNPQPEKVKKQGRE
jgi:hypothetical protein